MSVPYYSVGFLYHEASGQVLLHHRDANTSTAPNMWALFGGRSEPENGDDPIATWRREMQEELGILLRPEQIIPIADYIYLRGMRRYVFYATWPSVEEAFVLGEGQGYRWFTIEDALGHPAVTETAKNDLALLAARVLPHSPP